jgi:AraC-like DNA-binding protein
MSEIAFCRYFKSRTGKPFFIFLNDIRIGYACRLLQESNRSIMEICYESGFNNLSHFNRQFKEHIKDTPQQYRERFKK